MIDYEGTLLFVFSWTATLSIESRPKVIEYLKPAAIVILGDYDYYVEKKLEETELAAMQQSDVQEKAISQGKLFLPEQRTTKAIRHCSVKSLKLKQT